MEEVEKIPLAESNKEIKGFKIISIAQASGILITLALIKLILYYMNFNLPIKYYIGISGLSLVLTDDVIFAATMIPTAIILLVLSSDVKKNKENNIIVLPNWITKIFHLQFLKNYSSEHKVLVIKLILLLLFSICSFIAFFLKDFSDKLVLTIFFFGLISAILTVTFNDFFRDPNNNRTIRLFNFFYIVLVFLISNVIRDVREVKKGKFIGTTITTADSTYISSDTSYFIGQVEKYVFIYNSKQKNTLILPTESIKKIILQSK